MGTPDEEFALVIEAGDSIEIDLAKGLLSGAGIPCMVDGPDFDMAELGTVAHTNARGANLYVPKAAYEQAKQLLEAAWGKPGE